MAFHVPDVSMATGQKMCVDCRLLIIIIIIIIIIVSDVAIGCAGRAVHEGPSLWGPAEPCVGRGRGGFEILARKPAPILLRH